MKHTKRIIKLFEDLYQGSPWIDVNIVETLYHLDYKTVSKKIRPDVNSIWEITNHLILWRQNVLQRVNGQVITTPSHNYFMPIKDQSQVNWSKTIQKLEKTQTDWLLFLKTFNERDYDNLYSSEMTYYDHVQGIIQHDAYHLGQITLLLRLIE